MVGTSNQSVPEMAIDKIIGVVSVVWICVSFSYVLVLDIHGFYRI